MQHLFIHLPKPIFYTRHAKSRMRWRSISKEDIKMVLAAPQKKESLRNNRHHYFRQIGSKLIRVTFVEESEKFVIISAVDKNN